MHRHLVHIPTNRPLIAMNQRESHQRPECFIHSHCHGATWRVGELVALLNHSAHEQVHRNPIGMQKHTCLHQLLSRCIHTLHTDFQRGDHTAVASLVLHRLIQQLCFTCLALREV